MSEINSNRRMWCKICGITNLADARMVVDMGADAIGLNFYAASKRHVDLAEASAICRAVTSVSRVGLFVDADQAVVAETLAQCELDILQFHGSETADFCRQFARPYIKALRADDEDIEDVIAEYTDAWAIILDANVAGQLGGTGHVFDWRYWPKTETGQNLILAGGLAPENVAEGIAAVSPWGVDVSTGVEEEGSNGRVKDKSRVREFIQQARGRK